ncbi:MAG: hypothetical protein AAGI45_14855 [Cyanobacteria bacterium P01_H01_bin.26]
MSSPRFNISGFLRRDRRWRYRLGSFLLGVVTDTVQRLRFQP